VAEGIRKRHSKGCPARDSGRCNCKAGYEAWVFSRRDNKKIRRTFSREAEAKSWRADALTALSRGGLRASRPTTLIQAWEAFHEGAKAGVITNRSGDPYKPATLRSYERAMRLRVLPEFGHLRQSDLYRPDLQEVADGLLAKGLDPSTIKVTFLPLRAILRRALARGEVATNVCDGLELPAVRGRRERIASPTEAAALIAAVPKQDRAVWATAMYGGLRRGELQALQAGHIDLATGVIQVKFGWDEKEGQIELKSRAGRRAVPIAAVLRKFIVGQRRRVQRAGDGLAFGRTAKTPFDAKVFQERADKAWRDVNRRERAAAKEQGRKADLLTRITLHECRHTFASLMIAAGVNAKALQVFMGHSSVAITLDRYGHLMPGSEAEAAVLLDSYLDAAREGSKRQAGGATGAPTGASVAQA
jgi:integrase